MSRPDWLIATPERVELTLDPAPLGARILAGFTDFFFALTLAAGAGNLAVWLTPAALETAAALTCSFVVLWTYPVWFELRWHGQTPGKRLLGLRTVDARGLPLTFAQCLVRSVVRAIDQLPALGGVGLVAAWCDPWGRRLGDVAAGTMVVTEHPPGVPPAGLDLELRHSSLDTPRLRRLVRHRIGLDERELILALLLRAPALTPTARYDLMERCASHLRRRLDAAPIEGLSGESWVRGVAALCWRGHRQVSNAR